MNKKLLVLISAVVLMVSIAPAAFAQPPISEFPAPFIKNGSIDWNNDGVPDISIIIGEGGDAADVIGASMIAAKIGTNMYWSAADITLHKEAFGTAEPFKIINGTANLTVYTWVTNSPIADKTADRDWLVAVTGVTGVPTSAWYSYAEFEKASFGDQIQSHTYPDTDAADWDGSATLTKHIIVDQYYSPGAQGRPAFIEVKWCYTEYSTDSVGLPDYAIWWYPPRNLTVTSEMTGQSYKVPGVNSTNKSGRFMLRIWGGYKLNEPISIPFLGSGYTLTFTSIDNFGNTTLNRTEWPDPFLATEMNRWFELPQTGVGRVTFWLEKNSVILAASSIDLFNFTVMPVIGGLYSGTSIHNFWIPVNNTENMSWIDPDTGLRMSLIVEIKGVFPDYMGVWANITSWPLEKHFITYDVAGTEMIVVNRSFTSSDLRVPVNSFLDVPYTAPTAADLPSGFDTYGENLSWVSSANFSWYVVPQDVFYGAKEVQVFVSYPDNATVERTFITEPFTTTTSVTATYGGVSLQTYWGAIVPITANVPYYYVWQLDTYWSNHEGTTYFFGDLHDLGLPNPEIEDVATFWLVRNISLYKHGWAKYVDIETTMWKIFLNDSSLKTENHYYADAAQTVEDVVGSGKRVVDFAAYLIDLEGINVSGVYAGYFDRFTPGPAGEYTGTVDLRPNGTDVTPPSEQDSTFNGEDVFSIFHRFIYLATEDAAADAVESTYLILVGGPLVNKYVKQLNDSGLLPISFLGNDRLVDWTNKVWTLEDALATFPAAEGYPVEYVPHITSGLGVVEYATSNPWNSDSTVPVLVVAGTDRYGTMSASLALSDPTKIIRLTAANWYNAGRSGNPNAVIVVGIIPQVGVAAAAPANIVFVKVAGAGGSLTLGP